MPLRPVRVTNFQLRLLAIGALGTAAQVVLLRELLAAFAGNELTVGVVVAVWTLFESLGALVGARLPDTRARGSTPLLGVASVLVSLAATCVPALSRPVLGLLPAETLSIPQVVLVAAAAIALPAGLHGALFVVSAAALPSRQKSGEVPGVAYLLEGLGTGVAGLIVSLILIGRVPGLAIVALFGGLLAASCALARRAGLVAASVATVLLCGLVASSAARLERLALAAAWPGQEVTAVADSPYGKLVSLRRADQRVVLQDGMRLMSSPPSDPATIEQLVGLSLLTCRRPEKLLMFGPVLGGYLAEALKYPLADVTVVQPDSWLTRAVLAAGDSLVKREIADPRVRYVHADPFRFLATDREGYDCIIQAEPQPANLAASRLFTAEFYRLCRARLRPGGVLAVAGPGESSHLLPEISQVLRLRAGTLAAVFANVHVLAADFPLLLGSDQLLSLAPETLVLRLAGSGVQNKVLDQSYLAVLLDEFRQTMLAQELARSNAEGALGISSVLRPRELFLAMVCGNRLAWPAFGRWYDRVGRLPAGWLAVPLVLLLAVGLAGACRGGVLFKHGLGLFVSGFAGAAIVTMTVFGFQVRCGSAYSGVAFIITSFMLGAVAGAWAGTRFTHRGATAAFVVAEAALILCCVVQPVLARTGNAPAFALTAFLAAACLGLQFAVAGAARPGGVAARTGTLTALDLAGGFLGGLATALFLLPVYGLILTGTLVGAAKLSSLLAQLVPQPGPRR